MFIVRRSCIPFSAFKAGRQCKFSSVIANDSIRVPLSKIVATIGPASENLPVLPAVVEAGMRIMRINFSHATYDEADLRMRNLSSHCPGLDPGKPFNLRAVMLDTQGPEIRTGIFDVKEMMYETGDEVTITTKASDREKQSKETLWMSYANVINVVDVGQTILLDDGAIELKVLEKDAAAGTLRAICQNGGGLGNRKGVNIPGAILEGLPAMSDKDKSDIEWGIQNDVDFIAASFVRKPSDVTEIRDFCRGLIAQHSPGSPLPLIISKIESTEALDNFPEILDVSDAIMVARGDLGVEIPAEELTVVQKAIVKSSNEAGKPVIVATQMLESMQKKPRPTRAECTDVANAIFDGADCVMLSGESAKGKYPVEAVSTMNRIVASSEEYERLAGVVKQSAIRLSGDDTGPIGALASAVVMAANVVTAKCIVVLCNGDDDEGAIKIAQARPHQPIVSFVESEKMGRQQQIYRALHPVYSERLVGLTSGKFTAALDEAKKLGFVSTGDTAVIVSTEGSEHELGGSATMRISIVA